MVISRSDKNQQYRLFCLLAAAQLGICFSAAKPASAQAIPQAPPSNGIYSGTYSGALGKAIEKAEESPSEQTADQETAPLENTKTNAQTADAVTLPRIDAGQTDTESKMIAQAAQENSAIDFAPVKLPTRGNPLFQTNQFHTGILYKLPARMFFQSSTENSLRLETNVLQTLRRNRADMIYRVLPNVTLGYALTKTTRVSANYFFFRDQYTRNSSLLSRNIHSIGFQIQQDIPVSERTNITAGFMGRQLLLSRSQPLSDLLPSVQVTHRVGSKGLIYGGVLGQIRFRNTLGKFQEGDQFYTLGGMYRTPRWLFLWDNTFITNFGNRRLRFGPNNQNMIMTLQADYRISPRLPLVAFVRAQPIFNIGANQAIGFAGFNFRIFGGLRIDLNKSAIFPVKVKKK